MEIKRSGAKMKVPGRQQFLFLSHVFQTLGGLPVAQYMLKNFLKNNKEDKFLRSGIEVVMHGSFALSRAFKELFLRQ